MRFELFSIDQYIAVTEVAVAYSKGIASLLLGSFAVLMFAFSSFRAMVLGNTQDMTAWAFRLMLVIGCLSSYDRIFDTLVSASNGLVDEFAGETWREYTRDVLGQFAPMFEDAKVNESFSADDDTTSTQPSWWDRLLGIVRGGTLSFVILLAFAMQFVVFQILTAVSGVLAALLRVMGPILIAAGMLTEGRSLKQWFSSLIQVLLWPVVPPFLIMVVVQIGGGVAGLNNLVHGVATSIVITVLSLASPFIVSFILGRSGAGAVGAVVMALGFAAGRKLLAGAMGVQGGSSTAALTSTPASSALVPYRRPGDLVAQAAPGGMACHGRPDPGAVIIDASPEWIQPAARQLPPAQRMLRAPTHTGHGSASRSAA